MNSIDKFICLERTRPRRRTSYDEIRLYEVSRRGDDVTVRRNPFKTVRVIRGTRTYISLVVSDHRCSSIAFDVL